MPRSQYALPASERANLLHDPTQNPVSPAPAVSLLDTTALAAGWRPLVERFAESESGRLLQRFLEARRANGATLIPARPLRALELTDFDAVQAVILGQDPYHGPGQANGLAFAVPPGITAPPSLRNIHNEVERDIGRRPAPGALENWTRQGVLLLNAVLTVEDGKPGSHQGRGWEGFTDHVIETLSREREGLVFLLWGSYAQKKGAVIDPRRHRVLKAPHPSPLSAHRGFLGCGHFTAANEYLRRQNKAPIDWTLPPRAALTLP